MAEPERTIFNRTASEKLRSPDDLDKYLRVTNPSVWIVLVACVVLLAGLLAWGIFGAVTTSVETTGVVVDGKAMCFLSADDAAKIHAGDSALVGGETMKVADLSAVPVSRDEASQVLNSDYLLSTLVSGDWTHMVSFDGDTSKLDQGVPLKVTITTERVAPIRLILGGNA